MSSHSLYIHMQQNFVPTFIWLIVGWLYLQCVNNGCAAISQWGISAGIEKKNIKIFRDEPTDW